MTTVFDGWGRQVSHKTAGRKGQGITGRFLQGLQHSVVTLVTLASGDPMSSRRLGWLGYFSLLGYF